MDARTAARIAAAEAREPEQITPEEAAELAADRASDDGYRAHIHKQPPE